MINEETTSPENDVCLAPELGELVYAYYADALEEAEETAFEEHLDMCLRCHKLIVTLHLIETTLRENHDECFPKPSRREVIHTVLAAINASIAARRKRLRESVRSVIRRRAVRRGGVCFLVALIVSVCAWIYINRYWSADKLPEPAILTDGSSEPLSGDGSLDPNVRDSGNRPQTLLTPRKRPWSQPRQVARNQIAQIRLDSYVADDDYRGGHDILSKSKIVLPASRERLTNISFELPSKSKQGWYVVSVNDAYLNPVVTATARSTDGKRLDVALDLRQMDVRKSDSAEYYLAVSKEGEAPNIYALVLRFRDS